MKAMGRVPFFKMQGCGNDFILIDNRELGLDPGLMPGWAGALCRRAFGVGADGLIFLDKAPAGSGLDYRWHFFNADGSRAEMCGNGARCAARLAFELGLAPAGHVFGADAGPITAKVLDSGQVQVTLTKPVGLTLNIALDTDFGPLTAHFVDTGVPHAVIFVDDISGVDVAGLGRAVRTHPRFAPKGTNANFVQVKGPGELALRTYERGVEGETYACGTGAAASAAVAKALGLGGGVFSLTTTGGEVLGVDASGEELLLTGAAAHVFTGGFDPKDLGL